MIWLKRPLQPANGASLYVSEEMSSVLFSEDKMDTGIVVPCHILVLYGDPDSIYGCTSCGMSDI